MVIRNIAHVMFGYPARRPAPEVKKTAVKKDQPLPEPAKEQLRPHPIPLSVDDNEKTAEELLTVVEEGQEKGSVTTISQTPPVAQKQASTEEKPETVSAGKKQQEPSFEAEANQEKKNDNDMLSDLFKQEVEKKNTPTDLLTESLPSISMQELIYQTKELNTLIAERRKKKR